MGVLLEDQYIFFIISLSSF